MYFRRRIRSYVLVCTLGALLPGCLITTQSYNHGKLLNPGERLLTTGVGWRYSSRYLREDDLNDTTYDADGNPLPRPRPVDSTRLGWCTATIDYRVGVLRKLPFGKGLETGFHLEMAFRGTQRVTYEGRWEYEEDPAYGRTRIDTVSTTEPEFYGPPVLEIDTRLGLPDITLRRSIYHHNVSLGWMVGYWVDNGWFADYAAGWEFTHFIPYASARIFLAATDALGEPIDTTFFTRHDHTWGGRIIGGVSCKLPFNFSLLPEYITPELSLTFPNYTRAQRLGFNASLGIRWFLGQ